tara:strand:+ start:3272 stop:4561 length:1290 start_codon:yes stop_codon:yes gene_type:complete
VKKIAIVGLGYVGLPLALQFARSGINVLGLDVDEKKVNAINSAKSYIKHHSDLEISAQVNSGRLRASMDFAQSNDVEAVIICVPTPLKEGREPDLTYVLETGRKVAPHLRSGMLVVLESTTYPGTTEEQLLPELEKGSGLKAGKDFSLAYSPEREDPGNPQSQVGKIPKVIGGFTPACRKKAENLYGTAIELLVPVSSCRVAEATKLMENIFRAVNIALVNEMKGIYAALGIDIWEVINAAKTKPFGFMAFRPGPGLGGHCIPIDPFYLAWKARQHGQQARFIELAGEINSAMPELVVEGVVSALKNQGQLLSGSRILILGLAYKGDVDDVRESPSFVLWELLEAQGAEVSFYDPFVPVVPNTRDHSARAGTAGVSWDETTISSFDCVLISTNHTNVDYSELGQWAKLVIDTRNVMANVEAPQATVVMA